MMQHNHNKFKDSGGKKDEGHFNALTRYFFLLNRQFHTPVQLVAVMRNMLFCQRRRRSPADGDPMTGR